MEKEIIYTETEKKGRTLKIIIKGDESPSTIAQETKKLLKELESNGISVPLPETIHDILMDE